MAYEANTFMTELENDHTFLVEKCPIKVHPSNATKFHYLQTLEMFFVLANPKLTFTILFLHVITSHLIWRDRWPVIIFFPLTKTLKKHFSVWWDWKEFISFELLRVNAAFNGQFDWPKLEPWTLVCFIESNWRDVPSEHCKTIHW